MAVSSQGQVTMIVNNIDGSFGYVDTPTSVGTQIFPDNGGTAPGEFVSATR